MRHSSPRVRDRTNVRRRPKPTSVLATAVLVGSLIGCSSTNEPAAKPGSGVAAISVAPLSSAPPLKFGTPTDLPLVVNVWATWCGPCRKEMPAFDAVAKRYEGSVRFVGVNLGDEEPAAKKFVQETGVGFDQYLDHDSTTQIAFAITTMPATVFIRTDGTIAETHNGALGEPELETMLSERLGVEAPSP